MAHYSVPGATRPLINCPAWESHPGRLRQISPSVSICWKTSDGPSWMLHGGQGEWMDGNQR